MKQQPLTLVIDEWSAAIAELSNSATPEQQARLTKASSDLLEAFASTATELCAATVGGVLRDIEALERRVEKLERHVRK